MTIMTAKAYYDEARRKIAESLEPMSENSGWFLKKRAKNLSRLGIAAERWAEMCRREERIIQLKEYRSRIVNRIEVKKESIQIEVNELDELEQELERLDEEIGA